MQKLPKYSSLEEKSKNFNIVSIKTEEEFLSLIKTHKTKKGIYRGVNSSSYKIYSSLQRHMIINDIKVYDTNKYVNEYIAEFRKDELFLKYLNTFNITPSKLSIMGYLQHFSAPTTFIDFSHNINKSLYFACKELPKKRLLSYFEKKNDLENKISLYFIEDKDLDLIQITEVLDGYKKLKESFEKLAKNYSPEERNTVDMNKYFDKMFDTGVLNIFLIDNIKKFSTIYNTFNNIRIIAQEGLFINNSYNQLPLELSLKKFFSKSSQYQISPMEDTYYPGQEDDDIKYELTLEENKKKQVRLEKNIITSYEISTKLIPFINKYINLEKKDIFPKEEELVWEIFKRTKLKNLQKT